MNWLKIAVLALAFAGLSVPAFGAAATLTHGTFVSPDGRFILSVASETNIYGAELPELTIKDTIKGSVEHSDPNSGEGDGLSVLTPLFFIQWTGDSQSILVISHIAHGTIAATLHFDGSRWQQHLLQPPSPEDGHFTVLSQRVGLHQVEVVYAVDIAVGAETPTRHYRTSMTVNPASGAYSNVRNEILGNSAYPAEEFD